MTSAQIAKERLLWCKRQYRAELLAYHVGEWFRIMQKWIGPKWRLP